LNRIASIRLAVLVLAHAAPAVLTCHAKLMPNAQFFIHVDAKSDITAYENLSLLPNVHILKERIDIYWGGWNMVVAEIELMRKGLEYGCNRFALVSDDSFPLRRPEEMLTVLSEDTCFLGLWKMDVNDPASIRYNEFFYFDSWITTQRSHDIYKRYFTDRDIANIYELAQLKKVGKCRLAALYKGPQWWCLTDDIVAHILKHHDSEHHFRESFRFSLIPDEHYIQTIIGQSSYSKPLKSYPMWTEIHRVPAPWVYRSAAELGSAFASERIYIRKVSSELAEELTVSFTG
jgi:hypothetical protein